MEAHPFAARGFAHVAEAYERGRPGYPEAAIDWLAGRIGLRPGSTVVDVGAGTGKLTRALLRLGVHVVAVEPIESMRDVLARAVRGAEVVAGSAEAIPLPDASVDAVTAGQAAHWFRREAGAEIARVLHAGGGVGFIWNTRDLDDPLQAAIEELVQPPRETAPRQTWGRWRAAFEEGPFTPIEEAEFRHVHELALADVPALVSSFSYVGNLGEGERDDLVRRARELAEASENLSQGPGGIRVRLAYRTDAYACRLR